VLINLIDRVVEISETPIPAHDRFDREFVSNVGEIVHFSTGEGRAIDIEVARLLPAR